VTVGEWLVRRLPAPPAALRARLESALGPALGRDDAHATDILLEAAEALVRGLMRGDAASRQSALDLLAADALVTYAFEAAAESPAGLVADASRAMTRLAALAAPAPTSH
jgi:hypothetical protein